MARSTPIHVSMLSNFVVVIVLLSGAIIGTTFIGARRKLERLAQSLITHAFDKTQIQLANFFDPVTRELQMARTWGEAALLDIENVNDLNRLFVPLIENHPQISSLLVANGLGREYMLLRTAGKWTCRQTRRDEWGERTR